MLTNRRSRLAVGVLVACMAVACNGADARPAPSASSAPFRSISSPEGTLDGIAWLEPERIVFGFKRPEEGLGAETHLWQVDLGTGTSSAVTMPADPKCTRTEDVSPVRLADGRIGFQRRCSPGARGPLTFDTTLAALNLDGSISPLAELGDLPFVPRQVAWSPSLNEGFLWGGSRICDGVVAVDRSGIQPVDLQVTSSGRTFDLKDFDANDCTATGNAALPAWTVDGKFIAFFASADAIGKADAARLDAPYSLFIMDSHERKPREVLSNVVQPMGLAWSPVRRQLAFSGKVSGNPGLWILSTDSGQLTRAAAESQLDVAWSPDGSHLAALENQTKAPADPRIRIVVFDVSPEGTTK